VVINGVVVQVNSDNRQDITLKLAQVSQAVSVTAAAVAVDVESATLGQVIGSTEITELPLNGRQFLQLATLTAGVYAPGYQSSAEWLSGYRPSLTISVSGSRESSSEFLLDGIQSKQDFYGAIGLEPPVDSVAEFKIESGYFSPEFGLPGVTNVVIKSGTNQLHGAAWEFLRNNALDARNFFEANKGPYRQNQFGGNVGGRILKDKLFFFGDYEGLRIVQSFPEFQVVPTTAELQGDFTGLPTIYDPTTYNPTTGTAQPFPNNQIPPGDIVPFAKAYSQLWIPAPNSAPVPSLGGANLIGTNDHTQGDNKFDVKVDYVKSAKDSFFARFSLLNSSLLNTDLLPGFGSTFPMRSRNAVISWTHIFSPSVVNSFRAGLDRVFLDSMAAQNYAGPNYAAQVGLKNLYGIPACNSTPNVDIGGYANFGWSYGYCVITGNTNKILLDNLSIVRGRHSLSLGGGVTRENQAYYQDDANGGTFSFTGQYTGNGAADFLIGSPFLAFASPVLLPSYWLAWDPSAYINDRIQVTKKLTLNMGLRWQYAQPFHEKYQHEGYFDFTTGQIVYAFEPGARRSAFTPNYRDFAPRIGLAYSPRDNWAIRASYGLFYDQLRANDKSWGDPSSFPLWALSYYELGGTNVSGIDIAGLFPALSPSLQGSYGATIATIDGYHRPTPYVQQWTLSIQHTFPGNVFAEVAYLGTRGEHLSTRVNGNQDPSPPALSDTRSVQQRALYPYYSLIYADEGRSFSDSNGLELTVRKQMGHGLSFLSAYTWANSISNASEWWNFAYNNQQLQNGANPDQPRQRWVTSLVYGLPFGKQSTGLARQAIGGWTLDGIVTFQSGLPGTVTTLTDQSNTGAYAGYYMADRVCNGNLSGSARTRLEWFNTSCFVLPPFDTWGNAGYNPIWGPGTRNVDFAVLKDFEISEARKIQFRAEFFNAFNLVNFGMPDGILGTPGFGVITSASAPRQIQFALKFLF
jgi:hypothetical protein